MTLLIPKGQKVGRIKPKRLSSPRHLAFIRELPCCICGGVSEAHHLLRGVTRGTGRKAGDHETIPLCDICHRYLHLRAERDGDTAAETAFLGKRGIDGPALAAALWECSGGYEMCVEIIGARFSTTLPVTPPGSGRGD